MQYAGPQTPATFLADILGWSKHHQHEDANQNDCQYKRSGAANNVLPCSTRACVSWRVLPIRAMHTADCRSHQGARYQKRGLIREQSQPAQDGKRAWPASDSRLFASVCMQVHAVCISHICLRLSQGETCENARNHGRTHANCHVIVWLCIG